MMSCTILLVVVVWYMYLILVATLGQLITSNIQLLVYRGLLC